MRQHRKRTTTSALRLACALVLGLAVRSARADDGVSVYVRFEVEGDELRAVVTDGLVKASADTLAAVLGRQFDYWNFRPARANELPRLEFRIRAKEETYDIRVRLRDSDDKRVGGEKTFPLQPPGEAERVSGTTPNLNRIPLLAGLALQDWLQEDNGEALLQVLESGVPLAFKMEPAQPPPLRAILPLSWDRHWDLGMSCFLIVCEWPDSGIVQLHSRGVGIPSLYPGSNPFQALLVRHESWGPNGHLESIDHHLQHLAQLKPRKVYLEKLETFQGGSDFNIAPPAPRDSL